MHVFKMYKGKVKASPESVDSSSEDTKYVYKGLGQSIQQFWTFSSQTLEIFSAEMSWTLVWFLKFPSFGSSWPELKDQRHNRFSLPTVHDIMPSPFRVFDTFTISLNLPYLMTATYWRSADKWHNVLMYTVNKNGTFHKKSDLSLCVGKLDGEFRLVLLEFKARRSCQDQLLLHIVNLYHAHFTVAKQWLTVWAKGLDNFSEMKE